ncbi:20416_t:CDS:2 [Entrophospora sp. SA101]|nr:20416_t:CDS:2 [Entrophospora sp. SA101]
MEIYENKDFNSDDDNATVRGDESEAEHIDFPTFSNDDDAIRTQALVTRHY